MRLLFVCPDMRTGGAERHWATLIPALARARRRAVKLLALADEGPFFDDVRRARRPGGVPPPAAPHRPARPAACALSVGAAFEPDAVVTRGVSAQLVGEAIARRRGRRPRDERAHAAHARTAGCVPPRPHQRALTRLVARANRWRDRGDPSGRCRRSSGLGYPRGRIEVVPNGVFERDVRGRRARRRSSARRLLGAVRGRTAAREARGPVHRGRGRCAAREPGRSAATWPARARERERLERLGASGSGVTLLGRAARRARADPRPPTPSACPARRRRCR